MNNLFHDSHALALRHPWCLFSARRRQSWLPASRLSIVV